MISDDTTGYTVKNYNVERAASRQAYDYAEVDRAEDFRSFLRNTRTRNEIDILEHMAVRGFVRVTDFRSRICIETEVMTVDAAAGNRWRFEWGKAPSTLSVPVYPEGISRFTLREDR